MQINYWINLEWKKYELLWGSFSVVTYFRFEIIMTKILTFVIRWFCGEKEKGVSTLRVVSILDLKNSVSVIGNKIIYKVVV